MKIDTDFPGGNLLVASQSASSAVIAPDLRDTPRPWFWWCFRVTEAAGQQLEFEFNCPNVIGARGPAVSLDAGKTWQWLGRDADQSFHYQAPAEAQELRFAMAPTYLGSDLAAFLDQYREYPLLHQSTLCTSQAGRPVELLRIGADEAPHRVLLTCRHHACESLASYVLEGLMAAALADAARQWLRENCQFVIVPFVDKDGVERGDQGKCRQDRDHCVDYFGASRYVETAAIKEQADAWGAGRWRAALDLHCPWLHGPGHEHIFLVGLADDGASRAQQRFLEILSRSRQGELDIGPDDFLPFGEGWNSAPLESCIDWLVAGRKIPLASIIEFPYACVHGQTVTAGNARAFGADIARALELSLQQS